MPDVLAGERNVRAEEYIDFVGEMMYPKKLFKPYGHQPEDGRVSHTKIMKVLPSKLMPLTVSYQQNIDLGVLNESSKETCFLRYAF